MTTDHPVNGTALTYKVFEVHVHYYSVRTKSNGKSFTKRALAARILKYLCLRTSRYLGNEGLGLEQIAAFHKEASSQLKRILGTIDLSSYDGYTYCMEVSMIVTPEKGRNEQLIISNVFYRDFKSLIRDRGRLIKDQSWLVEASRRARRFYEGGLNYEN